MKAIFLTPIIAAAAALATPAAAQQVVPTPNSIASVLRDKGYQAEISKDGQGDPMIRSGSGGSKFIILFYGCKNNTNCATIQFYAGFKSSGNVSVGKVNEWNRTKRFGRAYIDKDGDPAIEMDVDLDDGGMSRLLFEDNLEYWVLLVDEYRKFASGD